MNFSSGTASPPREREGSLKRWWQPGPRPAREAASSGGAGSRYALTLIEVLLALTILSIGLFVMIATASRCLAVARQAKHYEKARHLLARVEVEEPLPLKEEIEEGTESGGFRGESSDYRWRRTIELVGEEEDALFEVTTRVMWSDRGQQAFEEVVTYLHAPPDVLRGTVESPAP